MSVTPQMGLNLPLPGSTAPDWAPLLNTAFSTIDLHDHTAGKGVQVPSSGLNINADLTFNGFNLTQARTLRLQQQAAAPAAAPDVGCIYVTTAGDLWYNNGAGLHVQITSGAALSAASLGGISGLGGTSAGAAYSNSTKTFTFSQAANQSALLDAGPVIIHDTAASALGITLQSPVGIGAAYALTFPTALPAANALLSLGTGGALSAFGTVNGTSLAISGNVTVGNNAALGGTVGTHLSIRSASNETHLYMEDTRGGSGNKVGRLAYDGGVGLPNPGWVFQNTDDTGTFVSNGLIVQRNGLVQLGVQATPVQPASIWTAISPNANWTAASGLAYWKDATGIVRIKGTASSGAGALVDIFTLPAGFRPNSSRVFVVNDNGSGATVTFVTVGAGGVVTITGNFTIGHFYPLDPISFLAEQ